MVTVRRSVQDEVFQRLLAERPLEACGLLGGTDGLVTKAYPAPNYADSAVRYEIDPKELLRIDREMDSDELDLIGIYHSHVHSEAYPSAADIRLAFYPNHFYFIVSLVDPHDPVMRAFRIRDGSVEEDPVEVISDM